MRWVLVVAGVLGLAGCNSTPVSELSYPEVQAIAKRIDQTCLKEGGPANSQGYNLCIRHYVQREHATRASNRQRQQAFAQALGEAGQNYSRQQQAIANRRVNCTSNAIGTTVYTNCY